VAKSRQSQRFYDLIKSTIIYDLTLYLSLLTVLCKVVCRLIIRNTVDNFVLFKAFVVIVQSSAVEKALASIIAYKS